MWRDLKGTHANHGAAVEFLVSLKRAWFEDDFRVGLETCQEICQVFGHWQNTESLATWNSSSEGLCSGK